MNVEKIDQFFIAIKMPKTENLHGKVIKIKMMSTVH